VQIQIGYTWPDTKYALAEAILPLLIRYKEGYTSDGFSLPIWMDSSPKEAYAPEEEEQLKQKWMDMLDKMILGFQSVLAYREPEAYEAAYDESLIQEAVDAFAKYYQHFWD
jgi:hypothetical protein